MESKTKVIRYPLYGRNKDYKLIDFKPVTFTLSLATTFPNVGSEIGITLKAGARVKIKPVLIEEDR